MQLVILAGGKGSRISEETISKPKPLIEIGNMPIIWHIMKYYSCFGINEFVVELSLLTIIKFLTVNNDSREVPELEVITHFEYGKY